MNTATFFRAASFLFIAAVSGCTHTTAVGPAADGVTGSWQWVESTGGIAGVTRTPGSAGYTLRAVFLSDGTYKEYRNGALVRATQFAIVREQTPFHGGLADVVHYADGAGVLPQEMVLAGTDTLRLADVCMDCFIHTYSRIR